MCEKVIERLPSMTAEERTQLRRNCERAVAQSRDHLVVQEARRVLLALEALAERELSFLARLPVARRIEYAFRRLPATAGERIAIRSLYEGAPACVSERGCRIEIDEIEPAWHRPFREMCRQRRHLLEACEDVRGRVGADEPGAGWLAPLLVADEDRRSMRLRPEAEAAFTSLGYVGVKTRTDIAD